MAYTGLRMIDGVNIYFFPTVKVVLSGLIRTIPSCQGTALGYLWAEYRPETFGITYKAQPTHGCCSPHFLLPHQCRLTGKKTAGRSWSEAGHSVPRAFPADGSFGRPCRPTPSAPAPLAPAAPFAPCGCRCPGPAFHPKHIKKQAGSAASKLQSRQNPIQPQEILMPLEYFHRLMGKHSSHSKLFYFQ